MIYQRGQRRDYRQWRALLDGSGADNDSSVDESDPDRDWSAGDMRRLFDKHLDYAAEFTTQGPSNAGLGAAAAAAEEASLADRSGSRGKC